MDVRCKYSYYGRDFANKIPYPEAYPDPGRYDYRMWMDWKGERIWLQDTYNPHVKPDKIRAYVKVPWTDSQEEY